MHLVFRNVLSNVTKTLLLFEMDVGPNFERSRIFKPTVLLHEPSQSMTERDDPGLQDSSTWQRISSHNYILFPWLQLQYGTDVTQFNFSDLLGPKTKGSCPVGCAATTFPDQKQERMANITEEKTFVSKSTSFGSHNGSAGIGTERGTGSQAFSTIENSAQHTSQAGQARASARRKRHRCPFCTVVCSNMGQLRGHLRCHTGERPFVCSVKECSRKFARNEELTRHKRIHSGIRPFVCEVCKKSFGRKDHLQKHAKTHLNPNEKKSYTCPECCQGYSRSDALARHKTTAHSPLRHEVTKY